MAVILAPGEYLADIPDTDGGFTAHYRCPVCHQCGVKLQNDLPEFSKKHPIYLECIHCGQSAAYRSANLRINYPETVKPRATAIRRPRKGRDPKIFGRDLY